MPEIRKGAKDSLTEGGAKSYPTNQGNIHTVKNDGSSDHKRGGVQTSRSGLNKELGKT